MKMKISKSIGICAAVLSLALASDAFAGSKKGSNGYSSYNGHQYSSRNNHNSRNYHDRRGSKKNRDKGQAAVPELNAAGAPIAFAMIAGIAGVAMERRRKKA